MQSVIFDPQMTTYDMASLEALVEEFKPTHSLEVGSWKGLSSSIIARHTNVLYCVDTWKGASDEPLMVEEAFEVDVFGIFCSNMKALNLEEKIKPLIMTSFEARVLFKLEHLDFVYIDGDHQYEAVKKDLDWWEQLKPGGILAGHDADEAHPGVLKALEGRFGNRYTVMQKSSVWFIQKEK